MRAAAAILTIIMLALPAGCAPPASQGDFGSPDPAAKLYAIRRAGAARDAKAVRPLVQELASDDPAVRMFAIQALERITGTRLGYNPYSDEVDRRQAIRRWLEALESGRFAEANGAKRNE
jgi:hypothetical protein